VILNLGQKRGDDLHWAAGYLEGEGCFSMGRNSRKGTAVQPILHVTTTDRDVAIRLADLLGVKAIERRKYPPNRKQPYIVRCTGRTAIAWMLTLWTLLGERRRARIAEVVRTWRTAPTFKPRRNAVCHSDRPHVAKGLCRSCYQRMWVAGRHRAA